MFKVMMMLFFMEGADWSWTWTRSFMGIFWWLLAY